MMFDTHAPAPKEKFLLMLVHLIVKGLKKLFGAEGARD